MTDPKLISIKDACQRYACSKTKFYQLISNQIIRPVKIGKATRIVVAEADAALLGQR